MTVTKHSAASATQSLGLLVFVWNSVPWYVLSALVRLEWDVYENMSRLRHHHRSCSDEMRCALMIDHVWCPVSWYCIANFCCIFHTGVRKGCTSWNDFKGMLLNSLSIDTVYNLLSVIWSMNHVSAGTLTNAAVNTLCPNWTKKKSNWQR